MSRPSDGRRGAVDESPGAVYRRRPRDAQPLLSASDGVEALTGYDAAALRERGWLDVVHPDDRDRVREAVESADPGEYREETYRVETAEGDRRHVRDRFVVAPGDPAALEGVLFDVTETERRRRELAEESELLDAIFEHIPIHVFVKDREARHVHRSDHLDFPEDVIGKRDIDVSFINEESARSAYEDDMRVIEEGEAILDQEEHYPAVGEWDLTSKVPLYDEDGEVMGVLGATRRITERKHAQQELEEKTERLENFADVVANDIRTPLTEARRHAERIDDLDADAEHAAAAGAAIQRAGAVVDDVLALSRDGEIPLDPEPVALTEVVADAWRAVASDDDTLLGPDADVELRADRSRLERVFESLFRNAVERGSTTEGSSRSASRSRSDDSGATVSIEVVEDGIAVEVDGAGRDAADRERTGGERRADAGPSPNLGLAGEIVEAHGWSIRSAGDESGDRVEITGVDLTMGADE